jgi:signal transduction histidine kinase
VRTHGDAEALVLEVHNEGEPIPPETLQHLFEPMRRGGGQSDRVGRSIGLGLFIVNHIILAHQGTIAVRSSAPEGTTLRVRLPKAPTT